MAGEIIMVSDHMLPMDSIIHIEWLQNPIRILARLRLTDEKTADGKDAVRIRYTVNGVEQINNLDDGSVAQGVTENEPDVCPPSKNGHKKASKNGMNRSLSRVYERLPHLFRGLLDNEPLPT